MLNPAACDAKTPRAGVGAPYCEKSSRAKGLTPGHRARYRRAVETSSYVIESMWERIPGCRKFDDRGGPEDRCLNRTDVQDRRSLEGCRERGEPVVNVAVHLVYLGTINNRQR